MTVFGTVKWFDAPRGYGFIDLDGRDVFVHHTKIRQEGYRRLGPGQKVSFLLCAGPRGEFAEQVEVVTWAMD